MGFEVCYFYHEKLDGEYNKEELKEFKKKVGDPFEETSLDKLAAAIMAQLARRDIWITNVDVYELSKKKISFKESKNGLVLKNKKFLFDSIGGSITAIEEEVIDDDSKQFAVEESTKTIYPHEQMSVQKEQRPKRVIDNVIFSPEVHQFAEIKKKNLRLTPDNKYQVFQKKPSPTGVGELYLILDDNNKEQLVSDIYFIPASINLFGDKELGFSDNNSQKSGANLLWGDATVDSMPNIRRR